MGVGPEKVRGDKPHLLLASAEEGRNADCNSSLAAVEVEPNRGPESGSRQRDGVLAESARGVQFVHEDVLKHGICVAATSN